MARHDTWPANRLLISIQITLTSSLGSPGLALGLGAANNFITNSSNKRSGLWGWQPTTHSSFPITRLAFWG